MKRLIEETVSRGFSPRMRLAAAPTSGACSAPGKMDDRGRQAPALRIGDQHGKARVHHADEGVGGAEINADNFAHGSSKVARSRAYVSKRLARPSLARHAAPMPLRRLPFRPAFPAGLAGRSVRVWTHRTRRKPLIIGMELNYPPFEMTDPGRQPHRRWRRHGPRARRLPASAHPDREHAVRGTHPRAEDRPHRPDHFLHDRDRRTAQVDRLFRSLPQHRPRDSRGEEQPHPRHRRRGQARASTSWSRPAPPARLTRATICTTPTCSTFRRTRPARWRSSRARPTRSSTTRCRSTSSRRKHPDSTRGILAPFQKESWAIGIRKGNTALETQVNAFLKDFRAHHGFDALGDKYLKADKEAFRKMGYPFYF